MSSPQGQNLGEHSGEMFVFVQFSICDDGECKLKRIIRDQPARKIIGNAQKQLMPDT